MHIHNSNQGSDQQCLPENRNSVQKATLHEVHKKPSKALFNILHPPPLAELNYIKLN